MATVQVGTNYPITVPDGDETVRQGDDAMLRMAADITHGLDTLLGLSSTGGTAVTALKAFVTKSLGDPAAAAIGGTVGAAIKIIAQNTADNKTALDGLTAVGGEITLAHTAAKAAQQAATDADTKASEAASSAADAHRDLAGLNKTGGKLFEVDRVVGEIVAPNIGSLAVLRAAVQKATDSSRNGHGNPSGTISAPIGTSYFDLSGGGGRTSTAAVQYVKSLDTGSSGWVRTQASVVGAYVTGTSLPVVGDGVHRLVKGTASRDNYSMYNGAGTFTIPESGWYDIRGWFLWRAVQGQRRYIYIWVNGVENAKNFYDTINDWSTSQSIGLMRPLKRGDTVQLVVLTYSDTTLQRHIISVARVGGI